jgi:CHAT domain-containing protein
LLKPIEKDLKAANAKTLLWYLDGTLRYIPLAALSPDGNKYLVEDYQNVILTSKTNNLQNQTSSKTQKVLGLGVSLAETVDNPILGKIPFPELPGTKRELFSIVSDETTKNEKGILTGKRFLDGAFTDENFKNSLRERKYNIVHIASHFYLGSKDATSFLLLGNGKTLPLSDIKGSSFIQFGGVDLVTLSACNTGFADNSNGAEVDSLADIIQTQGGKSVMATLWAVADESTSLLMSEFYRLRKANPKLTKAEAIQLAQKAMIEGKLKAESAGNLKGAEIVGSTNNSTGKLFEFDKDKPFAHPYFWSPFVLIGDWR